ncbi:MAG: transcriptional regulator [Actinobacteria bacterium]|nr:MAG: transcriptional regulator [Actinomycetota bacterium]
MESATETTSLVREIEIDASPETIWQFLVDPEKATRWMGQAATLDPRPGGVYRVEVIPGHTARGEFVELDPPHRLVQTWGWEPGEEGERPVPPGSSTIEIELVADGDGTLLRFTHKDLPDAKNVESHAHGWDHYFARLAIAAAGGDPGADPWLSGQM